MAGTVGRLTFMESKILELGKKQRDKGFQGGSFTPGFIRKETEYGYRAINIALESLIASGLVEKSVTTTYRDGARVELDVYTITDKGLQVVDDIAAGSVQINGKEPPTQPNTRTFPEQKPSRPWEPQRPPRQAETHAPGRDLAQTVAGLESTIQAMAEDMKALHLKLDRLMAAGQQVEPTPAKAPARAAEPTTPTGRKRKPRQLTREALFHRRLVLEAVVSAGKQFDVVLSEDVKRLYQEACKVAGVEPKGAAQFATFLKRMQGEGLIDLQRKGCKALGIKGQGTRVKVSLTQEGERTLTGKR